MLCSSQPSRSQKFLHSQKKNKSIYFHSAAANPTHIPKHYIFTILCRICTCTSSKVILIEAVLFFFLDASLGQRSSAGSVFLSSFKGSFLCHDPVFRGFQNLRRPAEDPSDSLSPNHRLAFNHLGNSYAEESELPFPSFI